MSLEEVCLAHMPQVLLRLAGERALVAGLDLDWGQQSSDLGQVKFQGPNGNKTVVLEDISPSGAGDWSESLTSSPY